MPSSMASSFSSIPASPKSPSSQQVEGEIKEEWKTCRCPARSPLLIAWTKENGGRRFWSCPNFRNGGCRFFMWKDVEPFPSQARAAISILLEENAKLKRQCGNDGEKEMRLVEKAKLLSIREEDVRKREKILNKKIKLLLSILAATVVLIAFLVGMFANV